MNAVFAILFLVLEVGVLFTFLRAGFYDWFELVLLLLIVLNVVKLRSMFAPKKDAEPNKSTKPGANAAPGTSAATNASTTPDAPAAPAVAAVIDTPAVPREVLTDLTGGEEETMEAYRARALKIMEEDPEITLRICHKCGKEYPMDLPMCPYCGGDRSDGRM